MTGSWTDILTANAAIRYVAQPIKFAEKQLKKYTKQRLVIPAAKV